MNNPTERGLANQPIPRSFPRLFHSDPEPQALRLIQTLTKQAIEVGRGPGRPTTVLSSSVVCWIRLYASVSVCAYAHSHMYIYTHI